MPGLAGALLADGSALGGCRNSLEQEHQDLQHTTLYNNKAAATSFFENPINGTNTTSSGPLAPVGVHHQIAKGTTTRAIDSAASTFLGAGRTSGGGSSSSSFFGGCNPNRGSSSFTTSAVGGRTSGLLHTRTSSSPRAMTSFLTTSNPHLVRRNRPRVHAEKSRVESRSISSSSSSSFREQFGASDSLHGGGRPGPRQVWTAIKMPTTSSSSTSFIPTADHSTTNTPVPFPVKATRATSDHLPEQTTCWRSPQHRAATAPRGVHGKKRSPTCFRLGSAPAGRRKSRTKPAPAEPNVDDKTLFGGIGPLCDAKEVLGPSGKGWRGCFEETARKSIHPPHIDDDDDRIQPSFWQRRTESFEDQQKIRQEAKSELIKKWIAEHETEHEEAEENRISGKVPRTLCITAGLKLGRCVWGSSRGDMRDEGCRCSSDAFVYGYKGNKEKESEQLELSKKEIFEEQLLIPTNDIQ
ncbi:unnamed protein product [Amoebophrya sp. A120]|nr:unnamed protein product [Amoebophrya sp. A120]|eukprot:GSA120T00020404001.1